jgi:hypothetical protein
MLSVLLTMVSHYLTLMPQDQEAIDPEELAHGMKYLEAAPVLVKYLTAWSCQKIHRLAELHRQSLSNASIPRAKSHKSRGFSHLA